MYGSLESIFDFIKVLLFTSIIICSCNSSEIIDQEEVDELASFYSSPSVQELMDNDSWDRAFEIQKQKIINSSEHEDLFQIYLLAKILKHKNEYLSADSLIKLYPSWHSRTNQDPLFYLQRLNLLAVVKRNLNQNLSADSLTALAFNLNKLSDKKDSLLWIESNLDHARSIFKKGSFDKSNRLLESCLIWYNRLKLRSPDIHYKIVSNLGENSIYIRNFKKGESFLLTADSIRNLHLRNDFRREITNTLSLAVASLFQGKVQAADRLINYIKELHVLNPTSSIQKAKLQYNIALLETAKGNARNAINAYEQSYRLYESIDPNRFISTINFIKHNLANQYLETGKVARAEALFYEIKNYYELKGGQDYILASTYFNLGRLMFEFKKWSPYKGDKFLQKSISLYSETFGDNNRNLIRPLLYLSKLNLLLKNVSAAEISLQKAILIATNEISPEDYYWGRLLEQKARISSFSLKHEQALIEIDRAIDFINNDKIKLHRLDLLFTKSRIILNQSLKSMDLSKANMVFRHFDSLQSTFLDTRIEIIHQEDKYGFLKKMRSINEEIIPIMYRMTKKGFKGYMLENIWKFIERGKASALLDATIQSNSMLDASVSDKLISKEAHIHSRKSYFETALKNFETKDKSNKEYLIQVKDSLVHYHDEYERLKSKLKISYPAYHFLKYNASPIELKILKASLTPSETLLEYFRTDTALYAFGVNSEDATFQKLALPKDFDAELETFLRSSKVAPQASVDFRTYYAKTAHKLYQILVKPLLDSLQAVPHEAKSQLIVVPDGKLGYLPFDVLLTDQPSDMYSYKSYPFLLKDYSIRSAYSATLMKVLEDKKVEEKELLAAFAPSYIKKETLLSGIKGSGAESCEAPKEEEFRELLQAGLELDKILEHLDGVRFDTLAASEEQFKAIANKYRILHLNMHGFTNDCDPMYSGLAFTPRTLLEQRGRGDSTNPTNEGILHAYEIYNMRINAELVVMSACQTGLGKIQAGEGIMSLARAFAHAGSPNTVMSLWQVDEAATRKLMDEFYKQLGEGKGKDEALQLAKLTYLNGNDEAHPFFWAGFVLIGDDKPIEKDLWLLKYGWMALLSLMLLIGVFLILRRNSMPVRN